jgi:hypothetical protein
MYKYMHENIIIRRVNFGKPQNYITYQFPEHKASSSGCYVERHEVYRLKKK